MNKTIVVIERDKCIQEILTNLLMNQGFTVKSLMFEESALQTVMDLKPCCIVLDIMRVSEVGTKLCRQFKENEYTSHIPIIALSTQSKAKTLKGVWADEVILKPFDIDDVIAAIENQAILKCSHKSMFEFEGAD
jgi:two-component system phosphate regulon response regulator PhoB